MKLEDGRCSDALTKMLSAYALFFLCPSLAWTDTHLFLHRSSTLYVSLVSLLCALEAGAETRTEQALTGVELSFG